MWIIIYSGCVLYVVCFVLFFFLWFYCSFCSFMFYIILICLRDVIFIISLLIVEFDWCYCYLINSFVLMKKFYVFFLVVFLRFCRFRERWSFRRGKKGKGKKRNCCYFVFGLGVWIELCKFDWISEVEKDYVRVFFYVV